MLGLIFRGFQFKDSTMDFVTIIVHVVERVNAAGHIVLLEGSNCSSESGSALSFIK